MRRQRFYNREVAHYVLLSRNVNMQRIGLTFKLREIFDIAHYDSIIEECVHIKSKVFKCMFDVH